ncbi:MAG: type II toxin-antitoxin system Phd/YefM family antitoxin [Bryobacteraceae bacterium]|nr:type II toxin-antitoxin system Phd/YefM family antitoxin [Bryobacteraceae bacterium]
MPFYSDSFPALRARHARLKAALACEQQFNADIEKKIFVEANPIPSPKRSRGYVETEGLHRKIGYVDARRNLAAVLDHVIDRQEPIIIHRPSYRDVAVIPAADLPGYLEFRAAKKFPKAA